TRKIFDELVKAAGDRTKLVSSLLTVVEAWGQKVPLFPWKDAAAGISSFCERLESVAKEIEEVSQYPFIAVAGFKVARHRRAKRVAFSGPVSDPMVVKRREEQFWKEAQEYPQELRQLARLLRWHGRLVKLSYEEIGKSVSGARQWVLLRKVAYHKIGRSVRIDPAEVERILAEGYVPACNAK